MPTFLLVLISDQTQFREFVSAIRLLTASRQQKVDDFRSHLSGAEFVRFADRIVMVN
jgi:hypothetical protein